MALDDIRWTQTLHALSDEKLLQRADELEEAAKEHRRTTNLLFYEPVSARAMKIHQSEKRIIGVGGGNRCGPLDARVLMADGTWRQLGEIQVGDRVLGVDPATGEARGANVVRTYRSGVRPVYRFTASDGGSFECTLDHRVPLYLGSGRTTSKGHAKQAHKREMRAYLEPINRRGSRNPSKRIAALSPRDAQFEGDRKLNIHPYLLGALLGDGSFTGGVTPKFHNTDAAVIERVRGHVERMGGELRKYAHGIEYGLAGCPLLRAELARLGLAGRRDRRKQLPAACLRLPRAERLELLAGLVDTDGTCDWFTSASQELARGFVALVRTLGGKATLHERRTASPWGKAWSVYWRLNCRLPLSRPEKQRALGGRSPDYARRVLREGVYVRHAPTGDIEVDHPGHCYVTGDWFVVSNSSKTESCLVELFSLATGVIPISLRDTTKWRDKFRGPINIRIVVESLTTTLRPIILPKLQFWRWHGADEPGGDRGHYGWVPKECLIRGEWDSSWLEKTRTLHFYCRDPDEPDRVLGESTCQFLSYDQDPSDFASGSFHHILHDEPPNLAIWRENQARVMDVRGRLLLAMTWPDDPAIKVDWIYDEVYDPAMEGSDEIDWFELDTRQNLNIDQEGIAQQQRMYGVELSKVRILGQPIRFLNRVHPLYTDHERWWCFMCRKDTNVALRDGSEVCICGSPEIVRYNHFLEFPVEPRMPTVCLLDPHPRKPHYFLWVQIDANDDWWTVAELMCEGTVLEARDEVEGLERQFGLDVRARLMDPNMGLSQSRAAINEETTWQDEFRDVGLWFDLADDSAVGRGRVDEMLQPEQHVLRPRLHVSAANCPTVNMQMKRYSWDDHKLALEKDQKQVPKPKDDDFPSLLKYLANYRPSYRVLREGQQIVHRRQTQAAVPRHGRRLEHERRRRQPGLWSGA